MNGKEMILGIVKDERLQVLLPESCRGDVVRLTRVDMVEAILPQAKEISLSDYEGGAILVAGRPSAGWVYRAEVVEVAGSILTLTVQKLFG